MHFCSGDPERFCGQQLPIRTHQQSHNKCAEEEQCRVLGLDWALGAARLRPLTQFLTVPAEQLMYANQRVVVWGQLLTNHILNQAVCRWNNSSPPRQNPLCTKRASHSSRAPSLGKNGFPTYTRQMMSYTFQSRKYTFARSSNTATRIERKDHIRRERDSQRPEEAQASNRNQRDCRSSVQRMPACHLN